MENIELAIEICQQVLEVQTSQATPIQWANTMMNLATAYANRVRGDHAENLKRAIETYQRALQVQTRQVMPVQ